MAEVSTSYEKERIKAGGTPFLINTSQTNLVLFLIITILGLGVLTAVVIIGVMNAEKDNTAVYAMITATASPILFGLLAFMQRASHVEQNSKLTEMTVRIGDAAFAAGRTTERDEMGKAAGLAVVAKESRAEITLLKDEAAALAEVARLTRAEIAALKQDVRTLGEAKTHPPDHTGPLEIVGEVRGQVTGEVVMKPGSTEK